MTLIPHLTSQDYLDIDNAAEWIGDQLRRHRIHVTQTKEKFGTVRVYLFFGYRTWYGFIFPQRLWRTGWLQFLDTFMFPERLNKLIISYQHKVYIRAYKEAVRRWPHIRDNILVGADYSELLKDIPFSDDYNNNSTDSEEGF